MSFAPWQREQCASRIAPTSLVYVAARLVGVPADAPLLAAARRLFEAERGIVSVPTWGRAWLALLGLYDWDGVHPMPPELWALPTSLPVHPSRRAFP